MANEKARAVLQFNEYDFRHRKVLEILRQRPRNKTELVVNAILHYAPTGTVYGDFSILRMGAGFSTAATVYQAADFIGKYQLSPRTLTSREESMVPKLPDWYIIPREVVRVCEHAKLTSQSSQPMRNFLFRGEAGTGKTMGAQAIAAGLHLP